MVQGLIQITALMFGLKDLLDFEMFTAWTERPCVGMDLLEIFWIISIPLIINSQKFLTLSM